jgi:SPP1 family predicted phage head-tail adaptor
MGTGQKRHLVTLANPGAPVSDGDGGYTPSTSTPLVPSQLWMEIVPATVRNLERVVANTLEAKASHIATARYHPQVTTKTVLTFDGRTFEVTGNVDTDERKREMTLLCVERVQ